MKELKVKIKGVSPTIMHNGQMCNPMNRYTKLMKEITGKRKKTDEDHAAIARIEWEAGLYFNDKREIVWPGLNIERMLIDAAKKIKMGSLLKTAIIVDGDAPILPKPQTKNLDALFETNSYVNAVVVNRARIMRTRPIFYDWALEFAVTFNDELINQRDLVQIIEIAGSQIGLSDFRPRFGRFLVESAK